MVSAPLLTSFPLISHLAPGFLHSSHSGHLAAPPSPRYTTLELRSCFLFALGPLGRLSDSVSVSLLTCQIATEGGGSDNTTYHVSLVGPRPGCSISWAFCSDSPMEPFWSPPKASSGFWLELVSARPLGAVSGKADLFQGCSLSLYASPGPLCWFGIKSHQPLNTSIH